MSTLHHPSHDAAPLLPSRAKQLWRAAAQGAYDSPRWHHVWQELYAVARGKRCLPCSNEDHLPPSKKQRCEPTHPVLQERTNVASNQHANQQRQPPLHIKPVPITPDVTTLDVHHDVHHAPQHAPHLPTRPPRRHFSVFIAPVYSALTSLLDLSKKLLGEHDRAHPAAMSPRNAMDPALSNPSPNQQPASSTPIATPTAMEHPNAATLLMRLSQGPHDGTPQHLHAPPSQTLDAEDVTPQHQQHPLQPYSHHAMQRVSHEDDDDTQVPSPFDSGQLSGQPMSTPFRKRVTFDLPATPRIFKYHHFHYATRTGPCVGDEQEDGHGRGNKHGGDVDGGRCGQVEDGQQCGDKTHDGATDGSPSNPMITSAPELVPIPRRLKYERQRRASTNTPASTRGAALVHKTCVVANSAHAMGVPSSNEMDVPQVQQLFREAYINLKLSTRLHQFQCVWAQCDFDGGDLKSRSHEEHLDAYKEASHRLLLALGRDAAETIRQRVEREWQQIKGIRRRTCASQPAWDLLASQPLPHVSSTTSSTKTRSILKRAPSPLVISMEEDGTPCRRVRLLEGPAPGCPTALFG